MNLFASAAPGYAKPPSTLDSDFVKGSKAFKKLARRGFVVVMGKQATPYQRPTPKKTPKKRRLKC